MLGDEGGGRINDVGRGEGKGACNASKEED
jgi:hypothetical protein